MVNTPGWNDVNINMYSDWKTAEHMGHSEMSKSLRPCVFAESKDNPKRTYFLLRGWMLWRARRDGWATARSGRRNQFDYDEMQLESDIRAFSAHSVEGAAEYLLGNKEADTLLRRWVPQLCARLEAIVALP